MPKITLEVTSLQAQVIDALAVQDDLTVDDLFGPWVRDLVHNRAGIDATDSDADQQARADKLTARADARKAERDAAAEAAPKQEESATQEA